MMFNNNNNDRKIFFQKNWDLELCYTGSNYPKSNTIYEKQLFLSQL